MVLDRYGMVLCHDKITYIKHYWLVGWYMVLNATFNIISVIGGGNQSTRKKPAACSKSLTNFITYCCIEYNLPSAGFELTILVVIGTDYTGSCISNNHTIRTKTTTETLLIYRPISLS